MAAQYVHIPEVSAHLKVGDFVFASSWSDASWRDGWVVGKIAEVSRGRVSVESAGGVWFRHAMRVSDERGAHLAKEYSFRCEHNYGFDAKLQADIFGVSTDPTTLAAEIASSCLEVAQLQARVAELEGALTRVLAEAVADDLDDWYRNAGEVLNRA